MKRITQTELRSLYQAPPDSLRNGIRAVLAPLPEGKEQTEVKKKLSLSILLAAVLAVMSVTALAAGSIRLFRLNGTGDNPIVPLEGAEELVVTDLGRAENAHVTLTVEEAVFDGQGVMALIRLTPKDGAHCAMYNPYLQDAPDEVYEKEPIDQRISWGSFDLTRPNGEEVLIINEPDLRELWIGDALVSIPQNQETAEAAGLPVYLDGGVLRMAGKEAMEVTRRKDGRQMIDYDVRLNISPGGGSAEPDALLAGTVNVARTAEGQEDGSVLLWFNGYAEHPITDCLELRVSGKTTLDGEDLPMDGLAFALTPVEWERRYTLLPKCGALDGIAIVKSASINLSRVRGYFAIEYDIQKDSPNDTVDFRVLDPDGAPLTAGMGWAGSGESACAQQYEFQALAEMPDQLILEALDENGNTLAHCPCSVEPLR